MKGLKRRLIQQISDQFATNRLTTGLDQLDPNVAAAICRVPREEFVNLQHRYQSYRNTALPIGYQQTISQPYIVALMTQLLNITPGQRVLEIGTGSGYQAAILAAMGAQTYSLEIVPELATSAQNRFNRLGITVNCLHKNGYLGHLQKAPYSGIIVCAAAPSAPANLLEQLAIGGRLVIPLKHEQEELLTVFTRQSAHCYSKNAILRVRFVPFTAIGENVALAG